MRSATFTCSQDVDPFRVTLLRDTGMRIAASVEEAIATGEIGEEAEGRGLVLCAKVTASQSAVTVECASPE